MELMLNKAWSTLSILYDLYPALVMITYPNYHGMWLITDISYQTIISYEVTKLEATIRFIFNGYVIVLAPHRDQDAGNHHLISHSVALS